MLNFLCIISKLSLVIEFCAIYAAGGGGFQIDLFNVVFFFVAFDIEFDCLVSDLLGTFDIVSAFIFNDCKHYKI